MRSNSILILVALLCGSASLVAQESETSSIDHVTPDGDHVTQQDNRVDFHNGQTFDVVQPSGSPGAHQTGGRDGNVVQQSPRQAAINQVVEHINELKASRNAIVKEEFDHLNEHDADFAAGLGAEWNNKMEELKGEMALNLDEFVKEMGRLRDLQQQK